MSKNIKLNNTDYMGISTVQLPTTDGGTASFKDVDEIEESSGGGGFELKGTYTVNTTGYYNNAGTIDQAIFTPSYENGMIILVSDAADEDWSDNAPGMGRLMIIYTRDKYILHSDGYRNGSGNNGLTAGTPVDRTTTGVGNAIAPPSGSIYATYLNTGQSVKKYEMELDSTMAEAFLYYTA